MFVELGSIEDRVLHISCSGEMYGGPDCMDSMNKIIEFLEDKKTAVDTLKIDLKNVTWISNTGLGSLVCLRSRLMKDDYTVTNIVLKNPNDRVKGVLEFTRLKLIFDIEEEEVMGDKSPMAIGEDGDCRECNAHYNPIGCKHANAGNTEIKGGKKVLPCGKEGHDSAVAE